MKDTRMNRRDFVKNSTLASAATALAVTGAAATASGHEVIPSGPLSAPRNTVPMGKLANQEFSRLMLGGNLISGYAHSRDLSYVAQLSRRYNTEAKILETLELAETHGINAMNSYVMDGNDALQKHWKRGGKMKWFVQVRVDPQGGFSQIKKAVDLGATAIHVNGDAAEALLRERDLEKLHKMVQAIRAEKVICGVAAHALSVIVQCEQAGFDVDFYQKTLHTHDYFTAPRPGETDDLGRYDNSWCKDPEEAVEYMFDVKKPWIAFKVMAAGAIPPRRAFEHAFNSGADFVLAGMFDWQVAEDVQIAKESMAGAKRIRPWYA